MSDLDIKETWLRWTALVAALVMVSMIGHDWSRDMYDLSQFLIGVFWGNWQGHYFSRKFMEETE